MSSRPSCSVKAAKSLRLNVASGGSRTRQHAAIQLSLAGRGREHPELAGEPGERPREAAHAAGWAIARGSGGHCVDRSRRPSTTIGIASDATAVSARVIEPSSVSTSAGSSARSRLVPPCRVFHGLEDVQRRARRRTGRQRHTVHHVQPRHRPGRGVAVVDRRDLLGGQLVGQWHGQGARLQVQRVGTPSSACRRNPFTD